MKKISNQNMVCTYCDKDAIQDTNPPVCEEHINIGKKATEDKTLKELENED